MRSGVNGRWAKRTPVASANAFAMAGATGLIGYFPTYALGNLISAQLWERITADLPELDEDFERGEFGPLREWLRDHVHRHGRKFTPMETLERAIGTNRIDAGPYIRHLQRKLELIYGIPVATG